MKIYNVVSEDYSAGNVDFEGLPISVRSFLNRKDAEDCIRENLKEAVEKVHPGQSLCDLREKDLLIDEDGSFWSLWYNESERYGRDHIYETDVELKAEGRSPSGGLPFPD